MLPIKHNGRRSNKKSNADLLPNRLDCKKSERTQKMNEGDAERLEQLVRNLLDNAVKYTPAGGSIRIEVGRVGEFAEVRVRDTGVGLDAVVSRQLFEPFVQGDSSHSRRYGGAGLGLSISRRLAVGGWTATAVMFGVAITFLVLA